MNEKKKLDKDLINNHFYQFFYWLPPQNQDYFAL